MCLMYCCSLFVCLFALLFVLCVNKNVHIFQTSCLLLSLNCVRLILKTPYVKTQMRQ